MLASAFNAQPNAPTYFEEAGRDVGKFRLIVGLGFGISILLNLVFLISGFLTFGSSSAGVILNSYAQTDPLAAVARALIGVTVVCGYPVVFAGLKPTMRGILGRFKRIKDGALLNQVITIFPLVGICTASVFVSNAGIVNAIRGAICGSSLNYIFPALMFLISSLPAVKNPAEKIGNAVLLVFGFLVSALGIYSSLKPNFPLHPLSSAAPSHAPPPPALRSPIGTDNDSYLKCVIL